MEPKIKNLSPDLTEHVPCYPHLCGWSVIGQHTWVNPPILCILSAFAWPRCVLNSHSCWREGEVKHIIIRFLLKISFSFFALLSIDWSVAYLRQPAVLVKAVSHSRWRGLQLSSPPLLPRSQPEWGTTTSSARACKAWSTISIFTESWDERFHKVPRAIY